MTSEAMTREINHMSILLIFPYQLRMHKWTQYLYSWPVTCLREKYCTRQTERVPSWMENERSDSALHTLITVQSLYNCTSTKDTDAGDGRRSVATSSDLRQMD